MTRRTGATVGGWLLAAAMAWAGAGCASSTGGMTGDAGSDAQGDTGGGGDARSDAGGGSDARSDASGGTDAGMGDAAPACPSDPATAEGMACPVDGQTCGECTDPCSFCNQLVCLNGHWSNIEAFPGQCDDGGVDAGSVDASDTDAQGVACGGMTCATNEVCVRTTGSGGACLMPQDGGCPDGTQLTGDCCVAHNESFQCAARPAGCDTLACGCASSLCQGGCQCQSASGDQLECACFFP